jgi:plastocyanin
LSGGANYTITFPTAGNYKLVCLVHTNMNGTVHVLPAAAALPFNQGDYYKQASDEARDLINDGDNVQQKLDDHRNSANEVIMSGEVAGTGGGRQSLAVVRFFPGTIRIKAGETVEWTNLDPTTPHTVTFGNEPPVPQVTVHVTQDPDGALHGTIASKTDSVSSGFLQAAGEDAVGLPQSPIFTAAPFPPGNLGLTRVRITFPTKGTYTYKCALHDTNGMLGTVIVE